MVSREPEFSPGQEQEDRLILEAVGAQLARRGIACRCQRTADLAECSLKETPDVVLAMCQGQPCLVRLDRFATAGTPVINHPRAIRRTARRESMLSALTQGPVLVPRSSVIATDERIEFPPGGAWIKRTGAHRLHRDDVMRANDAADAARALAELQLRGCEAAVVQEHVPGRVLKCYGVGTSVLWPAELDRAHRQQVLDAAGACGLEVYGVDLVVCAERTWVIDVNDWPSFSTCREQAAEAIAEVAARRLQPECAR